MIGRSLAHYEILGKLGEGGMGEVYRALDRKLDREVALKILPDDLASDPRLIERFEREAKTVAALNHPNIVTIHAIEEVEHPTMGRMRLPRPPARFSRSPAGVSRHAPCLGEHGDEALAELGLSEAERADLRAKGIVC